MRADEHRTLKVIVMGVQGGISLEYITAYYSSGFGWIN